MAVNEIHRIYIDHFTIEIREAIFPPVINNKQEREVDGNWVGGRKIWWIIIFVGSNN